MNRQLGNISATPTAKRQRPQAGETAYLQLGDALVIETAAVNDDLASKQTSQQILHIMNICVGPVMRQ